MFIATPHAASLVLGSRLDALEASRAIAAFSRERRRDQEVSARGRPRRVPRRGLSGRAGCADLSVGMRRRAGLVAPEQPDAELCPQ